MNSALIPGSNTRNITLRDVAERVGVSVQSVSKVLNGGDSSVRVSPATRRRIEEGAEALGYRRNHSARAMRMGDARMIGWVGGDLSEEHVGKMLSGAIETINARGYTLKILRMGTDSTREADIRRVSEMRLSGVLALHLSVATQQQLDAEARQYGYPLVLMDERSEKIDVPQIISDDEGGIARAVAHLNDLGHSRIAFISAEADPTQISRNRERAFCAAMEQRALRVPAEFITHGSFSVQEPSLRAARALLQRPERARPTAIVCSGDFIALAALKVARECGIEVPSQLSLVGFANMNFLDFVMPRLATIAQPFEAIGRRAVETLLDIVEPDSDAAQQSVQVAQKIVLPTRFIAGESIAPPPPPPPRAETELTVTSRQAAWN